MQQNTRFFKENLQIFSDDITHPNLGNIYLDKSVFPIFKESTLDLSPNEFLKSKNKHIINSEACEILQQGAAGEGLKIKSPILPKTTIGAYATIVKLGRPSKTEEESGKGVRMRLNFSMTDNFYYRSFKSNTFRGFKQ